MNAKITISPQLTAQKVEFDSDCTYLTFTCDNNYTAQIQRENAYEDYWRVIGVQDCHENDVSHQYMGCNVQVDPVQCFKKIKDSVWKCYFEEDVPLLIMIGPTYRDKYHVIEQDPFDTNHKLLTSQQIYDNYKITI